MRARRSSLLSLIAGIALAVGAAPAVLDDDISAAENTLFLADHLANLPANAVLRYSYATSGSMEAAREDGVRLVVSPSAAGSGRQVRIDHTSQAQTFELPVLESATANPVILFFLERDVREMQRLTGGQAAYFRKRLRLALAEAAEVTPVSVRFAGREVAATRVTVHPYRDDPLRKRFERLAEKVYTFTLSDRIPGAVYRMHTVIPATQAAEGTPPLLDETLMLLGSEP
jgi:hypothetical protein